MGQVKYSCKTSDYILLNKYIFRENYTFSTPPTPALKTDGKKWTHVKFQ